MEQDRETSRAFLGLLVVGYMIALSPLGGILFDVEPVSMLSFEFTAIFVWSLACIYIWIRDAVEGFARATKRMRS
jgi:hypothetical protein